MPELWRDGIDAATGESRGSDDLRHAAGARTGSTTGAAPVEDDDAIGGAIEPGDGLRLVDWAEFFCRYARDMLPFEARESVDFPGDNAAYRARRSTATRDVYRDGFWEHVVNRALRTEGFRLWHAPDSSSPGPLGGLPRVLSAAARSRPEVRPAARRALLGGA